MTEPTTVDTSAAAIAAVLKGVTNGPWSVFINDAGDRWTGWPISINCDVIDDKTIVRTGGMWPYEWDAKTSQSEACANARFIAAARDLVPALSAELTVLRAERDAALARVEELEAAIDAAFPKLKDANNYFDCEDAIAAVEDALAKGETL